MAAQVPYSPVLWRGTACLWLHRSPTLQRCGEGLPSCGCTGSLLSSAVERDRLPVTAQVPCSPALWRGTACLWLHRFPALQRCGEGPPACGCTGSLLSSAVERDCLPVAAQVPCSPVLWRGTACLWLHRFPALQRCGEGPTACGCTGSLLSLHSRTALLSLGCWFVYLFLCCIGSI